MSVNDPRSSFLFTNAPGTPTLPDVSQAALLIGVTDGIENVLEPFGTAAAVRSAHGECRLTEITDAHFSLDPARRSLAIVGAEEVTAGVLTLNLTDYVGTSVPSADGTLKPKGTWPGIQIEVLAGGTVGTPGIILGLSIDYGQTVTLVALGTATSVEFAGLGIKVNFATGDITSGVIAAYSTGPTWDTDSLNAAMNVALESKAMFSLIGIAEQLVPSQGTLLTGFLDDLEDSIPKRFCHLIGSVRSRYHTAGAVVTATFANANPDTLTRASGSFITDGFKPGMRVATTGAVNSGNNGTFVRIATVTATVLTFTSNVAFTAEAATAGVTVTGSENAADYAYNVVSEWSAFTDARVTLTVGELRAAKSGVAPWSTSQIDSPLNGYLLSRAIAEPIDMEPGQRRKTPRGGGPVAEKLGGRVYQGLSRVLPDVAQPTDAALVTTPSRFAAVQSEADGRAGVFFVETRTMFGDSDQIKFMRAARLGNEAKQVILKIQIDDILSGFATDPENSDHLSSKAIETLEKAGRSALKQRFRGPPPLISNLDSISEPVYTIDPDSDLSTGYINAEIFIRTKFYPNGFRTTLKIRAPGEE